MKRQLRKRSELKSCEAGRMKIARRFNGGERSANTQSPQGTAEFCAGAVNIGDILETIDPSSK
jgi:hypothetical protein